jgi:hypothetical protein
MKTVTALIYEGLLRIHPTAGPQLANFYARISNPVNYAIVGGIGVGVNFMVFLLLIGRLPWWATNIIAILTAWLWNWSQSVGPCGWVWGFKPRAKPGKK